MYIYIYMDTFYVTHEVYDVSIYLSLLFDEQQDKWCNICASCVTQNVSYIYDSGVRILIISDYVMK